MKTKGQVTAISFNAHCLTCAWTCHQRNAMAIAAQHSERNSHRVQVSMLEVIEFGGQRAGPSRQLDLGMPARRRHPRGRLA